MTLLNNELENWSAEDRALFTEETEFALALYGEFGDRANDSEFCEQKIMERFAAEEAARS